MSKAAFFPWLYPMSVLRRARRAAIGSAVVAGVAAFALFRFLLHPACYEWPIPVTVVGGAFASALTVMASSWGSFQSARIWLAVRGELPYSILAFLEDAKDGGILRRDGPAYEFRAVRLQQDIADPTSDPVIRRKVIDLTDSVLLDTEIRDAYENVGARHSELEEVVWSWATTPVLPQVTAQPAVPRQTRQ